MTNIVGKTLKLSPIVDEHTLQCELCGWLDVKTIFEKKKKTLFFKKKIYFYTTDARDSDRMKEEEEKVGFTMRQLEEEMDYQDIMY